MKKTHSLYVDEVLYSTVSLAVGRALSKRGKLTEFINFVERRTFDVFGNASAAEISVGKEADALYERWFKLPTGKLVEPLVEYVAHWAELAEKLPWNANNPAASHMLALFELQRRPIAWNLQPPRSQYSILAALRAESINVGEGVRWFHQSGLRARREPRQDAPFTHGRSIWRRNRVDLVWTPTFSPVSLYLDAEAHAFVANAFGADFYTKMFGILDHTFRNQFLVIDIGPELYFLEFGLSPIAVEQLRKTAKRVVEELFEMNYEWLVESGQVEMPSKEQLLEEACRGSHFDFMWGLFNKADWQAYRVLQVAERLGVLDGGWDLETLHQRTLAAFLSHHELTGLVQSYASVERILAKKPQRTKQPTTAVEYHLWELFKLYASDILAEPLEAPRLADSTLVTLAQSNIMSMRNTLERYSSGTVELTAEGTYRISKSRQVLLEISTERARLLTGILNSFIEDPLEVDPGTLNEVYGWLQSVPKGLPWTPATPLSFELGEAFLRQALELLEQKGWQFGPAAAALYCKMLDDALDGKGKIAKQLEGSEVVKRLRKVKVLL